MAKKLFDYVHELLSQQETLVVPDFGAFVLQKTTTFLNDGEYISIIFTAQQQHDDGVLKSYIVKDTNQTEDEIEEFISASLEEIYLEISNTGIFKVEGIGEFRAVNDSIVFKPYDEQFLKQKEAVSEKQEVNNDTMNRVEEEATPSTPIKEQVKQTLSLEEAAAAFLAEEAQNTKDNNETSHPVEIKIEQPKNNPDPIQRIEEEVKISKENNNPIRPAEQETSVSKPIDFKKLFTPLIILVIVVLLGGTFYYFRNEIANLNKPTVTNDTTHVATEENMQQLSDTLSEINNSSVSTEQSISETPQKTDTPPVEETQSKSHTNSYSSNVIRYGNIPTVVYYIARGAFNTKQEALTVKKNLDVTGFVAKIIETTNGKKYNVVVAEFADEASANEELNFSKQIDNQFYLLTVKPTNK